MIERRRRLHDAVPEAQPLGALRERGEEDLGRARVAVLLEEVVLDLPHVVEAERVGERALLERIAEQLVLGVVSPWPGQLMLVEEAELHRGSSHGGRSVALRAVSTRRRRMSI